MESKVANKKSLISPSTLGPGFRFHPTDEELVRYYLWRKVCRKGFGIDAISEIDIYKTEPWDLQCMSKLKTRDLEWYFFSALDKKYGNGGKTNRATEMGYWKTTGKDRAVYHNTRVVGMKKTLVYHSGRATKGQRTNWVMHEYRLSDLELKRTGVVQDAFVLCRVFQKSGPGPKNGEKYAAPFVEEEWDDDELELVPGDEATVEVDLGGGSWFGNHDLQKNDAPLRLNFQPADGSYFEETLGSLNNAQKLLVQQDCELKQSDEENISTLPIAVVTPLMQENKPVNLNDMDYLLDEMFLDSFDNFEYGDLGFLEADDLLNPVGTDTSALDMLDEYLAFSDANDDSSLFFACNPSDDLVSARPLLPQKELREGTEQATWPSGQLTEAASTPDEQELAEYQSDGQYRYIKKASQMLGNISAPPAFANEFPSKDIASGVLQMRNLSLSANKKDRSSYKHGLNFILSFGFSRGDNGSSSMESSVSILPGRSICTISWGWFYFMFFWGLFLSMSFKVGSYWVK